MPDHLVYLTIAAIVGSGIMTGLLFAFSLVVMHALRELSDEVAMQVMQRINVLIVRPLFLVLFLGTAFVCLALAIVAYRGLPGSGAAYLLAGSIGYLVGPLGITVVRNVPLNNQLARATRTEAKEAWPVYFRPWLAWNHVRTLVGAVATSLLCLGLALAVRGL